jgi:hypothetical protein
MVDEPVFLYFHMITGEAAAVLLVPPCTFKSTVSIDRKGPVEETRERIMLARVTVHTAATACRREGIPLDPWAVSAVSAHAPRRQWRLAAR